MVYLNCRINPFKQIQKESSLRAYYEKKGKIETFAGKFHCYHLVYYELFISITEAIKKEKELK